jgi:hypothetical protein
MTTTPACVRCMTCGDAKIQGRGSLKAYHGLPPKQDAGLVRVIPRAST